MSLFITGLAFDSPDYIQLAKISVLAASAVAALIGVIILSIAGNNIQENESG
jgi:NhaA family Na+:H+ antiporter